ncbi:hypothetical protein DPMN_023451 [Dreissena polymorpha]|nr:hypothetical protein DPMN_023451 [Dreissena polymorpha]
MSKSLNIQAVPRPCFNAKTVKAFSQVWRCSKPMPVSHMRQVQQKVCSDEGNDNSNNQVWNKAQTQLLIRSYQLLEGKVAQGKLRKKRMWKKIAEEMREKGYIIHQSKSTVGGRPLQGLTKT